LGYLYLVSSKRLGVYPIQSKTVLIGDLGLYGWQSLGGFLVFRVVRIDDLDQVLLITLTYSRLPELFLLYYKLLLLLYCYASLFYYEYHLTLLLLPLLKALSWGTISISILQLFWSTTCGFAAFSILDLILGCLG
jgi:hypothetical protein